MSLLLRKLPLLPWAGAALELQGCGFSLWARLLLQSRALGHVELGGYSRPLARRLSSVGAQT